MLYSVCHVAGAVKGQNSARLGFSWEDVIRVEYEPSKAIFETENSCLIAERK
jgi:hypothetical protein